MQNTCFTLANGCAGVGRADQSSINFGMFAQGVLTAGGDVAVSAGRDVRELSVSLPTTWTLRNGRQTAIGGGNTLTVDAGNDVLGGSYFVSTGRGTLRAYGNVGRSADDAPVLALQDAQLRVEAARGANIGGVFNPSYLFGGFDSTPYSVDSSLSLISAAGDLTLGSAATLPGSRYGVNLEAGTRPELREGLSYLLPAHLQVVAAGGDLNLLSAGELFPSADGQLELIADGDLTLLGRGNGRYLGLIDAPLALLPSIDNPLSADTIARSYIDQGPGSELLLRSPQALHAHDDEPMRLYSVSGSLYNGNPARSFVNGLPVQGFASAMRLYSDKPATIRAAQDIVNLWFQGQNLYASDITTIAAGRDLYDPVLQPAQLVPVIDLAGPGTLDLSAGRDIGPLTSAGEARDLGYLTRGGEQFPGIRTSGNTHNLYLPRSGANIRVRYGVAPGIDIDTFASRYIDPSVVHDPLDPTDPLGTPDYSARLVAFVGQVLSDRAARAQVTLPSTKLSPEQAWRIFVTLPQEQRQQFVGTVFLDLLDQVGLDYNAVVRRVIDRTHPQGIEYNRDNILYAGQYERGYAAIETLFPSDWGYTLNALDGSINGALDLRHTGTLDMRGSTIQTRYGGDIGILGPGGPLLVGSASAPPFTAATANTAAVGPSTQGILALQTGSISVFADSSLLLAQSRIFTQQGGDVMLWSSNGDINAGKGAKTSSEIPPLEFTCDDDLFCVVDTGSRVSGAGIAALQTQVDQPGGAVNLIAPAGTVDAGDAGIRVSGNLNVAAQQVANADNIQVEGVKVGVPTGSVDAGAVAVASAVAAAVTQSVEQAAGERKRDKDEELELFVEVLTPSAP